MRPTRVEKALPAISLQHFIAYSKRPSAWGIFTWLRRYVIFRATENYPDTSGDILRSGLLYHAPCPIGGDPVRL